MSKFTGKRHHVAPGNGFHPNNTYRELTNGLHTDGVSEWSISQYPLVECKAKDKIHMDYEGNEYVRREMCSYEKCSKS